METTILKIDGMTCGGCVASVTRVLKAIPGVEQADVDPELQGRGAYDRRVGPMVETFRGFPPFFLQPINFDGLYMETVRQRAAQAEAGGELANAEPVGNA